MVLLIHTNDEGIDDNYRVGAVDGTDVDDVDEDDGTIDGNDGVDDHCHDGAVDGTDLLQVHSSHACSRPRITHRAQIVPFHTTCTYVVKTPHDFFGALNALIAALCVKLCINECYTKR